MRHQDHIARVDALAETWASFYGKMDAYCRERAAWAASVVDKTAPDYTGHYEGYIAEAEEMIRRLEKRGYTVVALAVPPGKKQEAA